MPMKRVFKRRSYTGLAALMVLVAIAGGVVSCAHPSQSSETMAAFETMRVQLPAGVSDVDVYWPESAAQAPMVIIVHGFLRDRHNMSGWGQHLAKEGFVAVVPDLPTQSDHARNGRFISELQTYFGSGDSWSKRIDPSRVGLLGFSAGGMSSLLAAAESPQVKFWVGLDPVDMNGLGASAARKLGSRAVVITAEPSACNADGNARNIMAALPQAEQITIAGAVHVDAECPSSWLAELVCGRSTQERRDAFRLHATQALHEALANR